ncbi:MAG: glycerophosphoryl diester phosphodiesterase, partial [Chitinophagaceae bacterium]
FSFRYTLQPADWYTLFKHAVNDVYRFMDILTLKQTRQSLTSRILSMQRYLGTDSTSMWRVEDFNNRKIGAQAYLGGVVGSNRDAMKNSDYGAMWMLANITGDSILLNNRLPYARHFKLEQQQAAPGFFQGAAVGQYYLSKAKKFTEEWGTYVEPMGLTYYSMLDIGNILLFDTADAELKSRLALGAERLLQWQHADGHWEVGYDRGSEKTMFTDLKDYRPTFYGLIVAFRILKNKKYLDAAVRGADWFIKEASGKGFFLGVCGDLRFVADFATGQSAQAMLDLYDITGSKKYQQAAINIARFYTTSIYTHPVASRETRSVNGKSREDWEITQAGLSFEHGGSVGSANSQGPILLASHAGMFVRIFRLTGDSLYLNMARAAAFGRDAFVDSATSVASYYWRAMNNGAGPYPHHAWWQVGWLTDYLLAEIEMRSKGSIIFPQGFITPKVGPHKSYGFAPGKVFGVDAVLALNNNMVEIGDPYVDYFAARAVSGNVIYLLLMNDDDEKRKPEVGLKAAGLFPNGKGQVKDITILDENGMKISEIGGTSRLSIDLPAYGLRVIKVSFDK